MIKVVNYLEQAVYMLPNDDEEQDQLDGVICDNDDASSWDMDELDALEVCLMDSEPFYTHKPPKLLSPSMVVILNYRKGRSPKPNKIRMYNRRQYPAKTPANILPQVPEDLQVPEEITIHNIGSLDLVVVVNKVNFIVCDKSSITIPTAGNIYVGNRDGTFLYISNGVVTETDKVSTYVDSDFFIET